MGAPEAVLAQPAALLGRDLDERLPKLARMLGPRFEREFLQSAGHLDSRQRKALSSVTVGAAARLLAGGGTVESFVEQVEYNGRRLAKLDLPPRIVLGALQQYMRMLDPMLGDAELRTACEQLNFAVLLSLNNAFYDVREAETRTLFELSRAELDARTEDELLQGVLEVLARFCRAAEARLYILDNDDTARLAAAVPTASMRSSPADAAGLARPRFIKACSESGRRLIPDPAWRARFVSFWSVPLGDGRRRRAVLQFAFTKEYEWLPRELRLLTGAAEHAALAWQKQTLAAELASRERQVRDLAGHMAEVEERERRRISRELHDETGQVLLYLRLKLDMLGAAAPPPLRDGLEDARALIDRMVVDIRRLIADLSPSALETAGLGTAIRQLVARFRRAYGIPVRLRMARLPQVPAAVQVLLYRVLQECTNNVARHSRASAVNISLRAADEELRLTVEDNGIGFTNGDAGKAGSFGLAGMRERVALAGGRLTIQGRPGEGTKVEVRIPVPRGAAAIEALPPARIIEYGKNPSTAGR